ncbi:serine/threonine-protein kinase [Kitasatospora sp. NPDC006697]|uniref:serine/threonine-protein kinase n=1 Tax=Kitasatospora sp. NPDC006697 TaxID=3364020 RepID=UPI0036BE27E2
MEPLEAADPRELGGYRLLRRLGAGGMGRVYLGRSAGGRTVAVKAVRPELADDPEFRARFRQEVAAARRVDGRWTAPVLDADTEGPAPWVATGYIAGPSLTSAVQRFGPLPAQTVRVLGAGLAGALAAVHGLGLVHRDVKPSNVLLALDGPRLIDFGIARALDAGTLTQSGFVVGSPGFLSPEQARGDRVGPPSDLFSLAAVLAYAATGRSPFGEGVSAAVLLYRVLHEEPDLAGLPEGPLRALLAECLAKDPAARPTPERLAQRLLALETVQALDSAAAPAGDQATVRLGRPGWLPPAVAEAVGRQAVELLELEAEPPSAPPADAPSAGRTPRRRTLAAVLAGVLLLGAGGGLVAWHPWAAATKNQGDSSDDRSSPAESAPDAPSDSPSESPSAAESPSENDPPDSPAAGSPTGGTAPPLPPPSPGPSGASAVPVAFLGTWSGQVTTDHLGSLGQQSITVTVRAADLGAENTTSVDASGLLNLTCRGAWTLTSATRTALVFHSRLVAGTGCTDGSTEELDLNGDGTLAYHSQDGPAGNPKATLHKAG